MYTFFRLSNKYTWLSNQNSDSFGKNDKEETRATSTSRRVIWAIDLFSNRLEEINSRKNSLLFEWSFSFRVISEKRDSRREFSEPSTTLLPVSLLSHFWIICTKSSWPSSQCTPPDDVCDFFDLSFFLRLLMVSYPSCLLSQVRQLRENISSFKRRDQVSSRSREIYSSLMSHDRKHKTSHDPVLDGMILIQGKSRTCCD